MRASDNDPSSPLISTSGIAVVPAVAKSLRTVAMACDFDVMLNPDGPPSQVEAASESLELVQQLEQLLSVYRDNAHLASRPPCD